MTNQRNEIVPTTVMAEARAMPGSLIEDLKIHVVPHTVYILCGPTMAGKSTWAKQFNGMILNLGLSSAILSSDEFRHELMSHSQVLGYVTGDARHADSAMATSEQAFHMLFSKLKSITKFPISTEIVIVDTTGMDDTFRTTVKDIAERNNYRTVLVTFEYKTEAMYFLDSMGPETRAIVSAAVQRFRRKVLPNLGSSKYDERIRVRRRETNIVILNPDGMRDKDIYVNSDDIIVIGDVHECVEEARALTEKVEATYPHTSIVWIGDYLDKGGDTEAMVRFMHERLKQGDQFIQGNHEAFVVRRLKGELDPIDPEIEKVQFSSLAVLKDRPDLKALLFQVWHESVPFMIVRPENPGSGILPVYITHAPCHDRALGKITAGSIQEQRNYRTKDRSVPFVDDLEWFYKEGNGNYPLHVFGHVSHKVTHSHGLRFKNKVFLDTGCVYGNELTAVYIKAGRIAEVLSVPATKVRMEYNLSLNLGRGKPPEAQPFNIHAYELEKEDWRLLNQIERNGVKYISGTMSPGPSIEAGVGVDAEIEPLSAAFKFLSGRGVTHVIMEPKWMGSRAQLYVFRNQPEKTFMVSRGGWKIRRIEGLDDEGVAAFMKAQYDAVAKHFFVENSSYNEVILDGELLPWHALGSDLIKHSFQSYEKLVGDELNALLGKSGLDQFPDFIAKHGLEGKDTHLQAFHEVLGRFAQPSEAKFTPFSILHIDQPGWEANWPDEASRFYEVNGGDCKIVDLADEETILAGTEFFKTLTVDQGMEGVVLKPINLAGHEIPYMKVRSPEYLRLVYGYDYFDRLDRLCRQKRVTGKLSLSVKEDKLGKAMLTCPPEQRVEYAVKMISSMREERSLDPRL